MDTVPALPGGMSATTPRYPLIALALAALVTTAVAALAHVLG